MRSPIQDANAGVAMNVAPTKKHAVRTATIAQQGNNANLQGMQNSQKIGNLLGGAIGNFMENKHEEQMKTRYQEAFNATGAKTGMSEYRRDQKRTGFTEFIFNGQSPEYNGELDASARNASTSMYVEEAQFVEQGGGDMTPAKYQDYLYNKVKLYTEENFADAPDATLAFMKNWQDKSNELSRQQIKVHEVTNQRRAALVVAEGFQEDLSEFKTQVGLNPERAVQLGKDIVSGKNLPKDMYKPAGIAMIVEQTLVSMEAGDISALQLIKETDLAKTFDSKTIKRYRAAVKHLDANNASMLEAERLRYLTIAESDDSTSSQVLRAKEAFDTSRVSVSARDTGSSEHIKAMAGSDRWRGTIGRVYEDRLLASIAAGEKADGELVIATGEQAEVDRLYAPAEKQMDMLADRLDSVYLAMHDPSLNDPQRQALRDEFIAGKTKLNKWESSNGVRGDKANKLAADKAREEEDAELAGKAMLNSGSHIAESAKTKKNAVKYAVNHVLEAVAPADKTQNLSTTERLEGVLVNELALQSWLKGVKPFGNEVGTDLVVKNAVGNLSASLRIPNENNKFTEEQKSKALALDTIRLQNQTIYRQVFATADERAEVSTMIEAVKMGKGIEETRRQLDEDKRTSDLPIALKVPVKTVLANLGLDTAPPFIQSIAYAEYKANEKRGSNTALNVARDYMSNVHSTADNTFVEYGSTFKPTKDKSLDDTLKIMKQTYRDDSGKTLSGWTVALQRMYKNDNTKAGTEFYSLSQSPTVRVSIFDGQLMLTDGDRRTLISNESVGIAIDASNSRRAEARIDKATNSKRGSN